MDLRAAADTLDNFLAQIAAFAEMDGLQLTCLLDQVALGNLLAVAGTPIFDADDGRIFVRGGDRSCALQIGDQARPVVDGSENEESAHAGGIDVRDRSLTPARGRVRGLRNWPPEFMEHPGGLRTL